MAGVAAHDMSLRILVVDDAENIRLTLGMCLDAKGHAVTSVGGIQDAIDQLSRQVFDLVFLDMRLGVHNGLDYIARLRTDYPWTKIVVITAYASISTAVEAMKLGASDYLPKPFAPAQVELVTHKVAEQRRLEMKIEALRAAMGSMDPEADLPTENAGMRSTLNLARQVAESEATVFIYGEAGTGKARIARAIHAWSRRADAPFASVYCNTTLANELDAELFGMTRQDVSPPIDVPGRIELAKGGTVVLHEVAQAPPSLQPKLLRVLTEKEFERFEDFKTRRAQVRTIGTTSIDPDDAVKRKRLRNDLLLAMDVVRINIPPLRERPEDIRMLAARYLAFFAREYHKTVSGFTFEAGNALQKYPWPGNTRELRNLVERAVLLCRSEMIGLEHFPPNLLRDKTDFSVGDLVPLDTIEDLHIQRVLQATGSVKGAATVLGIGVSTMARWMKRAKNISQYAELAASEPSGAGNEKPAG